MKILKTVIIALLLVGTLALFAGCGSDILYGSWAHEYTSATNGQNQHEPPFALTYEIRKDGNVYVRDYLFGSFDKKRSEFTYTFKNGEVISGGYKIEGYIMTIYPDSTDEIYVFQKVATQE